MSNYWEIPAHEYIKEELTAYMMESNLSAPKDVIDKLLQLMPSAYEKEWKNHSLAVKAWLTLQVLKQSSLDYCKSEDLGEFIYDTNMYKIKKTSAQDKIRYLAKGGLEPVIPVGLKSCSEMFMCCRLPEGFTLGDNFDTSNITNMRCMFVRCKLPKGFTLGNKFDTSNVTNMLHMFRECTMPEGFTLGDKFDTSNVINMCHMFSKCKCSEGFTLGDKFDTSNVTEMRSMFYYCKLPKGFTLGDKFNISDTTDARLMFFETTLNGEKLFNSDKDILQMLGGKVNA